MKKKERKEWSENLGFDRIFRGPFSDTACTVECACYLRVCANNHRCLSFWAQHSLARMTSVWLFFVLLVCMRSGNIEKPVLCSPMPRRENHLLLYAGLPRNIAVRSVQCIHHLRHKLLFRRATFKPQRMALKRGKQRPVGDTKGDEAHKTGSPFVSCGRRSFPRSKMISHEMRPAVDVAVPQDMNYWLRL